MPRREMNGKNAFLSQQSRVATCWETTPLSFCVQCAYGISQGNKKEQIVRLTIQKVF